MGGDGEGGTGLGGKGVGVKGMVVMEETGRVATVRVVVGLHSTNAGEQTWCQRGRTECMGGVDDVIGEACRHIGQSQRLLSTVFDSKIHLKGG